MAGPITWQSIRTTAGEPADAMRPLAGAQQSFNGVFDGLQNILNQRLAVEQSNNGAIREANIQNYLDQVQAVATPEGMAAAKPTLKQAHAALDSAARAATRNAVDARTASLYQQTTAKNTFDDQARVLAERPVRMQISGLAAQAANASDPLEKALYYGQARQLADKSNILDKGTLFDEITKHEREGTRFSWEEQRKNADLTRIQNADAVAAGNLEVNRGQLKVAEANAGTNSFRTKLDAFKDAEESVRKYQADLAAKAGRFVGHEAADKLVSDAIDKMYPKDQDKRDAMRSAAGKVMAANPGMPVSIMLEQIAAENPGQWYHADSSEGSGLADRVKAVVGKRDFLAENKLTEAADAMRLDNLRRQAAALGSGLTASAPVTSPRLDGGGDKGGIEYPPTPADGSGPDDQPEAYVPTAAQAPAAKESPNLALRVKLEKQLKQAGELKEYSPAVAAVVASEKKLSTGVDGRRAAQEQAILDAARAEAEKRASTVQGSLGANALQSARNAAIKRQLEALDKADAAAKKARE